MVFIVKYTEVLFTEAGKKKKMLSISTRTAHLKTIEETEKTNGTYFLFYPAPECLSKYSTGGIICGQLTNH